MKCIGLEKVSVVLIILALGLGNVRAEEHEDTIYYEAEEGYTDTQGTPPGYDKGKKVGWRGADAPPGLAKKAELEKLKKLREENPEKFKQTIQQRKNKLKKRLAYLKKNNPEKFKALMQQRRINQKKHLKHLRRTNPEKFKEVVERKRNILENRLQKIKENNPEKFKEIVQKRKANQSRRLQHLKKTNPEKYKKVLKKHHYLKGNPPGPKGGPGAGPRYKKGKDHKRGPKGEKIGRKKHDGKQYDGKRSGGQRGGKRGGGGHRGGGRRK